MSRTGRQSVWITWQIHIYTSYLLLLSYKWTRVWNRRKVGLPLNCTLERMTREGIDGWVARKPTQAPLPNQWAFFYAMNLSSNLCWWWFGSKLESIHENFLSYCVDEASDSVICHLSSENQLRFCYPHSEHGAFLSSHGVSTVLCYSICGPWISDISFKRELIINVECQTPS